MVNNNRQRGIRLEIADRKLGDEWAGWDGCLDEKEISADSGKRLFIGFAILAAVIFSAIAIIFWYLIQPRIIQLSSILANIIGIMFLGSVVLLFTWLFLNILSVFFQKNLLLQIFRFEFSLTFLAPLVIRLSERFGFSKDQISNSFIKVSNVLTRIARKQFKPVKLLVLLPHCLQKSIRQKLLDLGEKYQIGVFVASGGSLARKIIIEQRPGAVIAIACERDLILGIQDVFFKIPVLGIPNSRPEGPCKNTLVDFTEVENAIKFFLQQ
jgi:hypothetical protein